MKFINTKFYKRWELQKLNSRVLKVLVYSLLIFFIILSLFFLNIKENIEAKSTTVKELKSTEQPEYVMPELTLPTNQPQTDLTLNICDNYLTKIEDISLWSKEKSHEIKKFYQNLVNGNTERTKLDYISIFSGVNFMRGRIFSINPFERKMLPPLADTNAEIMKNNASALFSQLIEEDNLVKLIQSFSKGELPINGYVYYSYKVIPPISHILLKNSNKRGQDAVLQLLDLGASPAFIDLVTATELSLPISFVDRLYMAGNANATRVYFDLGYYNSLALVATKSLSPELVSYWLSLNSPASPDPFHLNALDLLETPKNENQKNAYIEIFLSLMENGVKPNYQSTVDNLLSWLPKDLINSYESTFSEINDNKIPEDWKPSVYVNVFELYKIALQGHLQEEGTDIITNRCFLLMGNKMISLALSKKSKKRAIGVETKNISFELAAKKLLKEKQTENITIDELIDNLSMRNDLVGKLAIQGLLLSNVQNQLDSQNNRFKNEVSEEQRDALESAFTALELDDWQSIEEIIFDIEESNDKEKIDMLLMIAISSNQNWLTIESLLEQGADLPKNSIILLAQSNNVSLARRLIPYGLNIKLIDSIGNNAFYYSVIFNAKEMIAFLLSQGVELNINSKGLDPLDHALALIKYQTEIIQIVELLINGGINISKSHKERTSSYSHSNPSIYNQLISKFPQLLD
jgi:hypothetical protein